MRSWIKAFSLVLCFATATSACSVDSAANVQVNPGLTPTPQVPEIPEEYRNLNNPFAGDEQQAAEGEILYQANCASCHGVSGEGDGPASGGLEPRPKNLAVEIDAISDAYLFWRISEGGLMEPFNSVMPNWRGIMDEEQIWQVITYLRTFKK
jgi:mono/diheme cytochrome c family protein